MSLRTICVGVDGSSASSAALRWAAVEAASQNAELVVVHAYDWRVVGGRAQVGGANADARKVEAEALVEAAVRDARSVAARVSVRGEIVLGAPGPTMVDATRRFDLTVLGSRRRGGLARLLRGSVSQRVAVQGAGPVVVVRGHPGITAGPVVVGVDGSPASDLAVRLAFEEASARATGVLAVHAYMGHPSTWDTDGDPSVEDPYERRDAERRHLADDVAAWRAEYPDVPVRTLAMDGHTAEVLTGLACSAGLVVVGTRGHGGLTGHLLGSVGLHLLRHSACPVLIARESRAGISLDR